METRTLQYIAEACGGNLQSGKPGVLASGVCTDSRLAAPGCVFFALAGKNHDAHAYLNDVAQKGVAAVVAQPSKIPGGFVPCPVIAVEDTLEALGCLAARYRRDFDIPIVAIGGSNGKTTTKELLGAVLRQAGPALWTEGNFNNNIGVPLTLLRLERVHRAAAVEAGVNHPGELAPLLQMIAPRLGIITNIGREHLEFFGDLDGVAREEGVLAEKLGPEGILILNGDDPYAKILAQRTAARVVTTGLGSANDWRASDIRLSDDGARFRVSSPGATHDGEYAIRLLGRHQISNALLVLAAAAALGLDAGLIRRGLAECAPAKMRLQLHDFNGVRVLEDCYNANADSMAAALRALAEMPCAGRRVAVLGDMGELGAQSPQAHAETGALVAELAIDTLIAIGPKAAVIAETARARGLRGVAHTLDIDYAARSLAQTIRPGDLVLIKASRSMKLERLAAALRDGQWRTL
jgi:UDP-N-acetylmuramoyl-tripeptide--D-alanyl-D-alanine ligase